MEERPEAARLLALARQLREAAIHAARPDVAGKADEIIALVVVGDDPADGADQESGRDRKSNAVLKFLDGLGF